VAVPSLRPERVKEGRPALGQIHGVLETGRPRARNSALSASSDGLGAVSNLSPKKIELAPARKQSTWSSRLMWSRPALRRTRARGKARRAVAISRTSWRESTGGGPGRRGAGIGATEIVRAPFGRRAQ